MRLVFGMLIVAACGGIDESTPDASAVDASAAVADATGGDGISVDTCAAIDQRLFLSLQLLECGLGPMGEVFCNWAIEFDAGQYTWSYSDILQSGQYQCEGAMITEVGGQGYSGEYDAASDRVTWDGVVYEPS